MATYTRGNAANIVVGAAAIFIGNYGVNVNSTIQTGTNPGGGAPDFVEATSYKDTLANNVNYTSVGYTNNGLELAFDPTFGEVMVDQILDVAKLYKSGMQVTLKTSLAEATLENLLLALAQRGSVNRYTNTATTAAATITYTPGTSTENSTAHGKYIDLFSGDLGDYPVERSLIAIGAGLATVSNAATGTAVNDQTERVYVAYRVVNISNVTVAAKRDAATTFDVEFRLLPDANGAYGKIVDRTY